MFRKSLKPIIERFPVIAMSYRNLRDQIDRHQPSIKSPWGFTLAGHKDMAEGRFEPEETELVRALLKEVDILVNVGANVGYYCCHALSLGKPVIAAEPIPRNIHYLLRNITENGWTQQAEIFPIALGKKTDVLKMWGSGTGASLIKGWAGTPESYSDRVPVMTLDRILGDALYDKKALILIDVEGAEYMMLQGSSKALSNDPKPVWMVEVSSSEHQPCAVKANPNFKKVFDMFFDRGYRAYTADKAGQELTAFDVDKVAAGSLEIDAYNFIYR